MKRTTLAAASLLLLVPAPARAEDPKAACVSAHSEAQTLRSDSKLREAREKLLVCARPECPAAVRSDCAKWVGEVQEEIPSIMVAATDANGGDVADVRVIVDGTVVAKELTGQPIMLNPGSRTLRFERDGASPIERKLVVRVGERNRRIDVQFSPKLAGGSAPPGAGDGDAPSPEPDSGPSKGGGVPAATWILGGVGVLGLAGFTYFALDGSRKEDDLKKCKPSCPSDDVQSARTSYLLGDVSLGVGVLALAGAAYFYFSASPSKEQAAARAPLWLDVRSTSRGAAGFVGGHF
ncbi:MAG: hypothetical protein IPM35_34485 [Myxococcales bacterium]|nr:hypothetical protein [Myxococcales bacterium]